MTDIVERLRSSELLPACPYDQLSPHYRTAPDDKPCYVCGGLNDPDAPDLCRGADTRIMGEAAAEIERLREALAPFAAFAEKAEAFVIARAKDGGSPIMPSTDFRLADFKRAAAALTSDEGANARD